MPTHGSDVDTWDVPLNSNFNILDNLVGGLASVAVVAATNVVLNAAQLKCGTIGVSGAIASGAGIVFPAVNGWWSIYNLTTGPGPLTILSGSFAEVICIPPGEIIDIQVLGNAVKFRNLGRIGSWLDLPVSAVPLWISQCTIPPYLLCDGSAFNPATYPYLATMLGSSALPDFRGRNSFFLNGGSGRLTAGGAGIDGNTLFAAGGMDGVTLAANQIPSITSVNGTQNISVNSVNNIPAGGSLNTIGTPGSGTAVNFVSGPGLVAPAKQNSSGVNSISATYTNAGQVPVANAAPGIVSGIRLVRAG